MSKRLNELKVSEADCKEMEDKLRESSTKYEAMVNAFDGLIYICSQNQEIEFMNERFLKRTGYNPIGQKCYKALHDLDATCSWCVNEKVFNGETVRWEVLSPKDNRWYYVVNTPIRHSDGSMSKMAMIQDITERKQAEDEREKLILELKDALDKVKVLSGFLPICASCKNVRDDKGYWNQIEVYISEYSEAEFTHGLCPDCTKKLYPDYFKK